MNELSQMADADLPSTSIKMVYFDIDGTLLNQQGEYPSQLKAAIARIQALGVKRRLPQAGRNLPRSGSLMI